MKKNGFTLIELMIVIVIISVVAAMVMPLVTGDSVHRPAPSNAVRVPSPTQ